MLRSISSHWVIIRRVSGEAAWPGRTSCRICAQCAIMAFMSMPAIVEWSMPPEPRTPVTGPAFGGPLRLEAGAGVAMPDGWGAQAAISDNKAAETLSMEPVLVIIAANSFISCRETLARDLDGLQGEMGKVDTLRHKTSAQQRYISSIVAIAAVHLLALENNI